MTSFTNAFTGSQIAVAYPSGLPLALTAPITLDWPTTNAGINNVVALQIFINSTTSSANTITFPSAKNASLYFTSVLFNETGVTITLLKNDNSTLTTIAAGQSVTVTLVDNTTVAGTWVSWVNGAGTSSATAAALAGYGLIAISTTLNSNYLTPTLGSNVTIQTTDRASVKEWTGGAGTITLQAGSVYGNGFWFGFKALPTSGIITFTTGGAALINGSSSNYTLYPGNSAMFMVDSNNNWISFCDGEESFFITSVLNYNIIPATTTITLTTAQQANVIQNFTSTSGSLSVPCTITYNVNVPGFFFVTNKTTGGQTLTLTDGTNNFSVTPNQTILLQCNGTALVQGPSEVQNLTVVKKLIFLDSTTNVVGFQSAATNSIASQIYTLPTNFPPSTSYSTVNSTGVMTFTDSTLGALWAVRGGSTFTMASTGTTTLLYNNIEFQTSGGSYNAGTGTYTAPRAGIYQVNASLDLIFNCFIAGAIQLQISSNATSSNFYVLANLPATTGEITLNISGMYQLTAGQTIFAQFVVLTAAFGASPIMNQGSSLTITKVPGN